MNKFLNDIYDIAVDKMGKELSSEKDKEKAGFEMGFKAASLLLMDTDFYERWEAQNVTKD